MSCHDCPDSDRLSRGVLSDPDLISAIACAALLGAGLIAPRVGGSATIGFAFLIGACLAGGWHVTARSLEQLLRWRLDVDLLMLLAAIGAGIIGRLEESAILLFLFSLGHGLEGLATSRARNAIHALGTLTPRSARVVRDGEERDLPIEKIAVGDLVRVKPGERIPIDGTVRDGSSSVDQSPITGESLPVRREPGHPVFAGTVNGEGALGVETTRLSSDSTMARMIRLVEESQANKGRAQQVAERFTRVYTPIVIAGVPMVIVLLMHFAAMPFDDAFLRAMAVLVGASPCALVISTPSAVLAGVAQAARNGVLIKGGVYLEALGTVKAIAFDKTGTLTEGKPDVVALALADRVREREAIETACALDRDSSHPVARAIVRFAESKGFGEMRATEVQAIPGLGVAGIVGAQRAMIAGRRAFGVDRVPAIDAPLAAEIDRLEAGARTVSVVALGDRVLGAFGIADPVRPSARGVVEQLRAHGIGHTAMLTGDNGRVARVMADTVGVDSFAASLLPEQKIDEVKSLLAKWKSVAMVGDGVNDAPALATATVGIAMGASGTDVALEAADVALMADDLTRLPFAVGLSRAARRIIAQNVAISLGVVVLLIPLAALGVAPLGMAVVLHEGSTVIVAFNALRLLRYKGPR